MARTSWTFARCRDNTLFTDVYTQPWGSIATDALGDVFLAPPRGSDPCSMTLLVSHDDGETWSENVVDATPGTHADLPQLAATPGGDVLVAWRQSDDAAGGDRGHVAVAVSHDRGSSFDSPTLYESLNPGSIEVRSLNECDMVVAWYEPSDVEPPPHPIKLMTSHDGGRSFTPPRVVARGQDLFVLGAWESTIVVAWWTEGFEVRVTRSGDWGRTWSTPFAIDAPGGAGTDVFLPIVSTGDGHAELGAGQYTAFGPPYNVAWVIDSGDDGRTWSPTRAMLDESAPSGRGALIPSTGGRLDAIWGPLEPSDQPMQANSSPSHGLPGTWGPSPSTPSLGAVILDWFAATREPSGAIDLVDEDFRRRVPDAMTAYLDRSCDDTASWLPQAVLLDPDDPPTLEEELPLIAVAAGGRIHVTWMVGQSFTSDTFVHEALDVEPGARVVPTLACGPCGLPPQRVEAVVGDHPPCVGATFQWWLDDVLVPGEAGPALDVPASLSPGVHWFRYDVSCTSALPCGQSSRALPVTIPAPPAPVGPEDARDLRVAKRDGGLRLSWADTSAASTGYDIYMGTIQSLHVNRRYDHAALSCGVPRSPRTSVVTDRQEDMPAPDSYFLVSTASCVGEGGVGTNSFGVSRPVAGLGPPCGPLH